MTRYTIKEEIANSIIHGVGVLFSIVTLTILLVFAIQQKNTTSIIAFSIYGFCSTVLYSSSTLYHSFQRERLKKVLRVFDHASIFLFIAGTYTPISLIAMRGYWRIGVLTAIWTIAIGGILYKILTYNSFDKHEFISLSLYILMGWMLMIAFKPMMETVPLGFLGWLLAGGLVYTIGTVFYAINKIPYNHAVWHCFVLMGSVFHFVGIVKYLV